MQTVNQVLQALWEYAPRELKMEGDNVGLLAGREEAGVERIFLCLDITSEMVEEAASTGAQLLVAHHPLFFSLGQVTQSSAPALVQLLARGMSAICMHTNLDAAPGGVNDALMEAVGLVAEQGQQPGFFRVGKWMGDPSLSAFAKHVKQALGAPGVQLIDAGRPVRRVGLCSGSGMSELPAALAQGCDTFLTGEGKHSGFLQVRERGINLIAAGHYATEAVVLPRVAAFLRQWDPRLQVFLSQREKSPYQMI